MAANTRAVHCTHCGARIKCPAHLARFRCPACKEPNVVVEAAAPAPAAPSARGADRSSAGVLLLCGTLTGVLAALLLSAAKPVLTYLGLVAAAAVGAVILALLFIGLRAAAWGTTVAAGEQRAAAARLRRRLGTTLLFAAPCWAVCAALVAAEFTAPPEGLVRSAFAPPPVPAAVVADLVPAPEALEYDALAGMNLDFVLVNHADRAVGLRAVAGDTYEVRLRAADEDPVGRVKKSAWANRIPIYASDPGLTRRVYDTCDAGMPVTDECRQGLARLFQPVTFVPARTAVLAFDDLVAKRRRVGHVIQDQGEQFAFADLLPQRVAPGSASGFETEPVERAARVRPGSEQRLATERALKESADDLLDFCLYAMLAKLQAVRNDVAVPHLRKPPKVFVDVAAFVQVGEFTTFDGIKGGLGQLNMGDPARQPFRQALDATAAQLLDRYSRRLQERETEADRLAAQSEQRRQADEDLRAMRDDLRKLRRLVEVEGMLPAEIRTRLVRAGITLIDRSPRSATLLRKESLQREWQRPEAQEAVAAGLADATHLLMTDIRKSDEAGGYWLSMRLVDACTSEILWEDYGVRKDSGGAVPPAPGGSVGLPTNANAPPVPEVPHPDGAPPLAPAPSRPAEKTLALDLGKGVTLHCMHIPAGQFLMGAPDDDKDAQANEKPRHTVIISSPFYLGRTEVTVGQFRQFVGETNYRTESEKDGLGGNGFVNRQTGLAQRRQYSWHNVGYPLTDEHPVGNVTWRDAMEFCSWLSRKTGKAATLPTEAQWEYACRAGTTTRFSFGDDEQQLGQFAWHGRRSDNDAWTWRVGAKRPNEFGLHDMHGNAWEWCRDGQRVFHAGTVLDPEGPSAKGHVVRCGVIGSEEYCRSAFRGFVHADDSRTLTLGFRVCVLPTAPLAPEPKSPAKRAARDNVWRNAAGTEIELLREGTNFAIQLVSSSEYERYELKGTYYGGSHRFHVSSWDIVRKPAAKAAPPAGENELPIEVVNVNFLDSRTNYGSDLVISFPVYQTNPQGKRVMVRTIRHVFERSAKT